MRSPFKNEKGIQTRQPQFFSFPFHRVAFTFHIFYEIYTFSSFFLVFFTRMDWLGTFLRYQLTLINPGPVSYKYDRTV